MEDCYDEDVFLEDRMFPWLASDCMADETDSLSFADSPVLLCDCGCGLDGCEPECPDCGQCFAGGEG